MNAKPFLAPALALVVGLAAGAALDTWWERPRLARARAELEVLQAAERSQRQATIKNLTEELAREHERAVRLEGAVKGLHR